MSSVYAFVLAEVAAEAQRRAEAASPAAAGAGEAPAMPVSEEVMQMLSPGGFALVLSFQPKPLPNDATALRAAGVTKRDKLIARLTS